MTQELLQALYERGSDWFICVSMLYMALRILKQQDLDLCGEVIYWIVVGFFWLTSIEMIRLLFF